MDKEKKEKKKTNDSTSIDRCMNESLTRARLKMKNIKGYLCPKHPRSLPNIPSALMRFQTSKPLLEMGLVATLFHPNNQCFNGQLSPMYINHNESSTYRIHKITFSIHLFLSLLLQTHSHFQIKNQYTHPYHVHSSRPSHPPPPPSRKRHPHPGGQQSNRH